MSLPKLQTLANITDFNALQEDLLNALLNSPQLDKVNIIEERKFLLASDVEMSAVWQTQRNGCCGAGIIVEMARANVSTPNVTGPAFDLQFGFVVIEERNSNFTPGIGTFLMAEQIAQIIFDILHLMAIEPYGTLTAKNILPANDWLDADAGLAAQRATLVLKNPRKQTPRVGPVAIAIAEGFATLSCATDPSATIYYTQDDSFPGGNNPAKEIYSEPFAVESGVVLRAAAVIEGKNISAIRRLVVP